MRLPSKFCFQTQIVPLHIGSHATEEDAARAIDNFLKVRRCKLTL